MTRLPDVGGTGRSLEAEGPLGGPAPPPASVVPPLLSRWPLFQPPTSRREAGGAAPRADLAVRLLIKINVCLGFRLSRALVFPAGRGRARGSSGRRGAGSRRPAGVWAGSGGAVRGVLSSALTLHSLAPVVLALDEAK